MPYLTEDEIAELGIDMVKVGKLVSQLEKIGRELAKMNLEFFANSGSGELIVIGKDHDVVADFPCDGGDADF